jgi:lipopolysaccharide export system protein LptA
MCVRELLITASLLTAMASVAVCQEPDEFRPDVRVVQVASGDVSISSDAARFSEEQNVLELEGNVIVRSRESARVQISANRVSRDQGTGLTVLEGDVRLTFENSVLRAERVVMRDADTGMDAVEFRMEQAIVVSAQ